jgi:hypothetical protein
MFVQCWCHCRVPQLHHLQWLTLLSFVVCQLLFSRVKKMRERLGDSSQGHPQIVFHFLSGFFCVWKSTTISLPFFDNYFWTTAEPSCDMLSRKPSLFEMNEWLELVARIPCQKIGTSRHFAGSPRNYAQLGRHSRFKKYMCTVLNRVNFNVFFRVLSAFRKWVTNVKTECWLNVT